MRELTALVDMDGTLCDYHSAIAKLKAYHPNTSSEELRKEPGFWFNLEPIPDGLRLFSLLELYGFNTHVLTKGPREHSLACKEKIDWCVKHLGEYVDVITVRQKTSKSLVFGHVLVEDWLEYALPWLEAHDGLLVLMDQPWNRGVEHPRMFRWMRSDLSHSWSDNVGEWSDQAELLGGLLQDLKDRVLADVG